MVRLAQTVHLSCVKVRTISKQIESSFHLSHITKEYHCVRPKWFLGLSYILAQTVHLSCTNTNTICKWTETRFHMAHITKEFHRVCPKQFLSLWYVRRKLCTYLAWRLVLSPNRLNRAFTWTSSSKNIIGCVQNNFWAYGTFGANRAPIWHRH
jgi:hypothetical protein